MPSGSSATSLQGVRPVYTHWPLIRYSWSKWLNVPTCLCSWDIVGGPHNPRVVTMTDWWHVCDLSPQMAFGVGKVQMKFLHLLSTEASHSITLHCLTDPPSGTADGLSSAGPTPEHNTRFRFRGWNRQMFEKDTLLEPHVLEDECKVSSSTPLMEFFYTSLGLAQENRFLYLNRCS